MGFFKYLMEMLFGWGQVKEKFEMTEVKRKVYHVVANPEGGWFLKEENVKRPVAEAQNKKDAIGIAKKLAKRAKLGQVIIHKMDGKIQREYTYGKDPRSSKG